MAPFLLCGVLLVTLHFSVEAGLLWEWPRDDKVANMEDDVSGTESTSQVTTIEDEIKDLEKAIDDLVACKAVAMSMIGDIRERQGMNDADFKAMACTNAKELYENTLDLEKACKALSSVGLMVFAHGLESDVAGCEDAVEVGLMRVREITNTTGVYHAVLSKWAKMSADTNFYGSFLKKLISSYIIHEDTGTAIVLLPKSDRGFSNSLNDQTDTLDGSHGSTKP